MIVKTFLSSSFLIAGIVLATASIVGQLSGVREYITAPMFSGGVVFTILALLFREQNVAATAAAKSRKKAFLLLIAVFVAGAVISYFGMRKQHPEFGTALPLFSAIAAAIFAAAILLRTYFRPSKQPVLKRKKLYWLSAAAAVCFGASVISSHVGRHSNECRRIDYEISLANKKLNQSSPGLERADAFIKRLRAIDTSHAPVTLQEALNDYVVTFERALTEYRITGHSGLEDQQIASKQKKVAEAINACK